MTLNNAADWSNIGQLILGLVVAFGGGFLVIGYIRTMKPVWKRFSSNVSRQVAVISTEKQSMEHEANLLEKVGYFKVKHLAADERSLNLIRGFVLIVVGYSPNSKVYKAALAYAKTNDLPIIVFAHKHWLTDKDKKELKAYSYSSICETDLRLVSDVFSVMSTFPEGKK